MHAVARSTSTGTVTFFFSDIEGSTRLLEALGADYASVLERHRRILREASRACAAAEMGTEGDSFFAVFPSARDAVVAAVGIQRAIAGEEWPQEAELRVRIGLHTGEADIADADYGDGRATRRGAGARGDRATTKARQGVLSAGSGVGLRAVSLRRPIASASRYPRAALHATRSIPAAFESVQPGIRPGTGTVSSTAGGRARERLRRGAPIARMLGRRRLDDAPGARHPRRHAAVQPHLRLLQRVRPRRAAGSDPRPPSGRASTSSTESSSSSPSGAFTVNVNLDVGAGIESPAEALVVAASLVDEWRRPRARA